MSKGVASEVGKDCWGKIKHLFGWERDPAPGALATETAQGFLQDDQLALQVLQLLKQSGGSQSFAGALAAGVQAEKIVVVQTMQVTGDFRM